MQHIISYVSWNVLYLTNTATTVISIQAAGHYDHLWKIYPLISKVWQWIFINAVTFLYLLLIFFVIIICHIYFITLSSKAFHKFELVYHITTSLLFFLPVHIVFSYLFFLTVSKRGIWYKEMLLWPCLNPASWNAHDLREFDLLFSVSWRWTYLAVPSKKYLLRVDLLSPHTFLMYFHMSHVRDLEFPVFDTLLVKMFGLTKLLLSVAPVVHQNPWTLQQSLNISLHAMNLFEFHLKGGILCATEINLPLNSLGSWGLLLLWLTFWIFVCVTDRFIYLALRPVQILRASSGIESSIVGNAVPRR